MRGRSIVAVVMASTLGVLAGAADAQSVRSATTVAQSTTERSLPNDGRTEREGRPGQGQSGQDPSRQGGDTPGTKPGSERFEPGETVRDRPQPQYDPIGIRLGGFTFLPSLAVKETYDSNIFFRRDDEIDDFVTTISPLLQINSDWSRHSLSLSAGADAKFFLDNPDENVINYTTDAKGTVDILRELTLEVATGLDFLHEDRGSPDDVAGDEPTSVAVIESSALLKYIPGRYLGELGFSHVNRNYDDVDSTGGAVINNDDRDRDEVKITGKLGYEIVPEYIAFVRGEFERRAYVHGRDDNGFDRDSDGYRIEIGTDIDVSGIIVGDVGIGYMERWFDDDQLNNPSGISANANLYWHVTPLTTLFTNLSRDVSETTIIQASSSIDSRVTIGVDHELLRNLILGATATYSRTEYEGITREDDLYDVSLSADYRLNPNWELSATLGRDERQSSIDTSEYTRYTAFFLVRYSL